MASCACAAGVYTSVALVPLCAHLLESFGALHNLEDFVSNHGRRFYKAPVSENAKKLVLTRTSPTAESEGRVPTVCVHPSHAKMSDGERDKLQVVPFWGGKQLAWKIES